MEPLSHCLLEYHQNALETIRKKHGLDDVETRERILGELETWMEAQKQYKTRNFSRRYLESILINSKALPDRAKCRLDRSRVLRAEAPQFFKECDAKKEFQSLHGIISVAVLPKMTADHSRVLICRQASGPYPADTISLGSRIIFLLFEHLREADVNDGLELVVDFREAHMMRVAASMSIFHIRKIATIFIEGYGMRLKGIHFITTSFIINFLMTIIKKVISAKVGDRMQVHKDLESLHRVLDKSILPEEYGGLERPLETLSDEWLDILSSEEFRDSHRRINEGFAGNDDNTHDKS